MCKQKPTPIILAVPTRSRPIQIKAKKRRDKFSQPSTIHQCRTKEKSGCGRAGSEFCCFLESTNTRGSTLVNKVWSPQEDKLACISPDEANYNPQGPISQRFTIPTRHLAHPACMSLAPQTMANNTTAVAPIKRR